MNARERKAFRSRVELARLHAWVLAYLEQHGPSLFQDILRDLNAKRGQLFKIGARMKKEGVLYVDHASEGVDDRKVWSLTPFPPKRPQAPAVKLPRAGGIGLDPEDLAWMAYWQLPRAERRARDYAAQGERRP